MEKRIERKFKNCQKRLAKKIAEAHETKSFRVDYEQMIPSARQQNGKWKVDRTQIIFPAVRIVDNNCHKMVVIMTFKADKCDLKGIGRILSRGHKVEPTYDGFKIRMSFHPNTVAMFR